MLIDIHILSSFRNGLKFTKKPCDGGTAKTYIPIFSLFSTKNLSYCSNSYVYLDSPIPNDSITFKGFFFGLEGN